MTIAATSLLVEKFRGNDSASDFSFSFWVAKESDISVAQSDENGEETSLKLNTDYTVSLNAGNHGGVVRLNSALPSGYTLAITRSTPINQELDLVNQGAFYAEDHETAFDKLTAICQELKAILGRCLIVPITSDKTPQEVMTDLLDVASKAQEYAQRAEEIYNEVKATGLYVSSTWQEIQEAKAIIDINKAAIDAAVARAEEILARNEEIGKEVDAIFPHIEDVKTNAIHIDEIHKVGQDLMTTDAGTLDLGSITDPDIDTASTVVGGYIKKVAEHLDESDGCIHKVGNHIEDLEAVVANEENINTVASDLKGLTVTTLDLGLITEDAEDIATVEGGYLKAVAQVSTEVAAVGTHTDELIIVSENIPILETAASVASSLEETRQTVLAKSQEVAENTETARASAIEATASAQASKASEEKSSLSETNAKSSETNAANSELKAKESETNAGLSAQSALASAEQASASEAAAIAASNAAIEANTKAGFSYRYLANASPLGTYPLSDIHPSSLLKTGDHVVNSIGEVYEVASVNETEAVLSEKICSIKGEKGDTGTGITVKGRFESVEGLETAHPTGEIGDAYLIDTHVYYWSENGQWEDAGDLQGPQGEQGIQGEKGDTGVTPEITFSIATGEAGTEATGVQSGTAEAPVLSLTIPRGVDGITPSISIEVVMLNAGETASVEKTGTDAAPTFTLKIPKGDTGERGPTGEIPETVDLGGLS